MSLGCRPYGADPSFLQYFSKNRRPAYNRRPTIHSLIPTLGAFHYEQEDDGRLKMLRWALGFFVVALIAGLLGFTGISLAAAGIAKILFYLFLILFLVTLMGHLLRRS
jgi:uncharacterized membrane protein YtjA (UPF0391 family)